MKKQMQKLRKRAGQVPGSAVHIGKRKMDKTGITLISYDKESAIRKDELDFSEISSSMTLNRVNWVNINGLHNTEELKNLSEKLSIHPLLLEDILDTSQRPKHDMEDDHILLVLKMFTWDEEKKSLDFEQVSFLLGTGWLISFQEKVGDTFEPVRERIKNSNSRIRTLGSDYLIYSLLDAVVDSYFKIIAELSDRIDFFEGEIISSPEPEVLSSIHQLKQEILYFRKTCWHLRAAVSSLTRKSSNLIDENLNSFFNDLQDNLIQVIDSIETNREILNGLLDIYLSSLSNKMNQVMKTLTIFAAIFIPLTFLAGIYGMNFQYMPELGWKWSYPVWWIVTLVIVIVMFIFFKKKKWL